MLMNHKNFHFTQIPDKTNDVIFLKSPKTIFWAIFDNFWLFLPDGEFSQNIWLCHTYLGPLTLCEVSEKTNEPILRTLKDRWKEGRKDRRKDGWTDPIL